MLILLAFSAAAIVAVPEGRPCLREGVQHARTFQPPVQAPPLSRRKLGELPDAHLMHAVLKRDGRGCTILPIVQRNVSGAAPRPSGPQGRRERKR